MQAVFAAGQTELPEIKPLVTEDQRHRLTCPCCQETTCAPLPHGVPTGMSGPKLIAFVALLRACFRQSKRRTSLFVTSLWNMPCCPSLTVKHQNLATAALRPGYEELAAALPLQPSLNGDESPTKQAQTKAWLWTFLEVQGVEPTNNAAERSLRCSAAAALGLAPPSSVGGLGCFWRKLSFGTQSEQGSRFVETMLTTIETCRQQNRSVIDHVTQTLEAHFHKPTPPSLLTKA